MLKKYRRRFCDVTNMLVSLVCGEVKSLGYYSICAYLLFMNESLISNHSVFIDNDNICGWKNTILCFHLTNFLNLKFVEEKFLKNVFLCLDVA